MMLALADDTTKTSTPSTARIFRADAAWRWLVCALGPVGFVLLIGLREGLDPAVGTAVVLTCLGGFFTPLTPWSIPAIVYQDERDAALPHMNRLVRGLVLVPWLFLSPQSTVRVAHFANLAGLIAALAVWNIFFV